MTLIELILSLFSLLAAFFIPILVFDVAAGTVFAWTALIVGSIGVGILAGIASDMALNVIRHWALRYQLRKFIETEAYNYGTVH